MFFMAVNDLPNNFPSFFKIILEPRHDLHKLGIPEKFMTEYGSDLLDVVSLKIPTGKTWEVELLKENCRTWFNDGWHEVIKFCSICHGHFLMFTYEGKSRFNLYIFDMTACEIEYPLDRHETRNVRKRVSENRTKISRKVGAVITDEDIKKINSYQFKNPSFAVIMHPTHVLRTRNYFRLQIPLNFAVEYLRNAQGTVTLQNATGDTWPVRCVRISPKRMILSRGWKQFTLGNKLCVSDICVFELIDAVACLFKVEIIRHSSPGSSVDVGVAGHETRKVRKKVSKNRTKIDSTAPVSWSQEKGMSFLVRKYIRKFGTLTQLQVKEINSYQFEIPSFTVLMQPSYVALKYCLNVPLTFGGEHTSIKPGNYTLENASGGTWPVRCFGSSLKYEKFYIRWEQFVLDNNLRVGDICVFELNKVDKSLIRVEIIRCSSDAAVASPSSSMKSEDVTDDCGYFN